MKEWFKSKVNWTAIGLIVLGLKDFIDGWDIANMTWQDWLTSAFGILVFVFRTYFTSTTIGSASKP
jgi:hypothetical protein